MARMSQLVALLIMVLVSVPDSRTDVVHAPVWFNYLMAQKGCTFARMRYCDGNCDLRMFFKGRYPQYLHIIGLGLNDQLQPDTTEFAEALCRCGVMEVSGTCSAQLIGVLTQLRNACGAENFRAIPSPTMTEEQWVNGEQPPVYQTVQQRSVVLEEEPQPAPPPSYYELGDYF